LGDGEQLIDLVDGGAEVPEGLRRHLDVAAEAPRTIELYSQNVRCSSRWRADRGREPVLDEETHAVARPREIDCDQRVAAARAQPVAQLRRTGTSTVGRGGTG
jgi:hypothetical protein